MTGDTGTRTYADLAAAFALIERSADEYDERSTHGPTAVLDLVPAPDTLRSTPSRRSRRRRRPVVVGVAALAASAAALIGALVGLRPSDSSSGPAAGGGPTPIASDGRSMPFTLSPSSGLQVISVVSTATGRTAELVARTAHLSVWTGLTDRAAHVSPGLDPVSIGSLRGYYDDGAQSALTTTATTPTPSSTATPGFTQQPAVVWEYAPSAFAVVTGIDPDFPPSRAVLLQAARDVRITNSVPLTLSFRLAASPALGTLTSITSTPRITDADRPPYTFVTGATACEATYSLPDSGNGVSVTVGTTAQGVDAGSGVAMVVDGHDARWDERFHQLVVDLGDDAHARIVEENFTGRWTLSLRRLEQVFGLITAVPDIADPATWIAAQTGLP